MAEAAAAAMEVREEGEEAVTAAVVEVEEVVVDAKSFNLSNGFETGSTAFFNILLRLHWKPSTSSSSSCMLQYLPSLFSSDR